MATAAVVIMIEGKCEAKQEGATTRADWERMTTPLVGLCLLAGGEGTRPANQPT